MSIRLESVYKIWNRNKKISTSDMEYINNTKLISDLIEMITIDMMQIYCLYDVPGSLRLLPRKTLAFIDRK